MTRFRIAKAVAPAVALALVPSVASAQHLEGVAYVLLPPVVLAPLLAAILRMAMRGSVVRTFWSALACAWAELVLWLACAFFAANLWFAERWMAPAVAMLLVTLVASWTLNGWWLRTARNGSALRRMLFVPMVPVAVVVLLVAAYLLITAWERVT